MFPVWDEWDNVFKVMLVGMNILFKMICEERIVKLIVLVFKDLKASDKEDFRL